MWGRSLKRAGRDARERTHRRTTRASPTPTRALACADRTFQTPRCVSPCLPCALAIPRRGSLHLRRTFSHRCRTLLNPPRVLLCPRRKLLDPHRTSLNPRRILRCALRAGRWLFQIGRFMERGRQSGRRNPASLQRAGQETNFSATLINRVPCPADLTFVRAGSCWVV